MNLTVLRAKGMDALRALRIPNVLFSTDPEDEGGDGPIPGGILETIVAQEMMGKKDDLASTKTSRKRKLTEDAEPPKKRARTTGNADTKSALTTSGKPFPLLKLSAELRNSIYEYAMTIDGPINPSKRHPTSHHRSDPPRSSKNKFRPGPAPESALALLLVNKQVKNEALGIYYSNNQLEFHSPQQLETFLQSISDERKECIRKLKLYTKLSDDHSLEEQLLSANNLKNLEHFELGLVSYKSGEKNLMAHSRWASEQEWLRKLGGRGVKVKLWSFSIDGDEGNP
ncbi:hypothetical protein BDV95DRAFT_566424 [Massariosphaeria phaeospora]|uniref:Uncharacterized protein n=1 Tax=Massariosphaeria phaeospora TaxID=100035 RepID=A0A7C8MC56_9PLEO|nr:hypothetical protein BDV95DRAFT_566424 [Massariosphaeria phaeospora]